MTAKQFGGGLVSVEIKEPVYLLCMNHGDNRFEGPFMKAMNEALDYIEKHVSDRTEGALVTICKESFVHHMNMIPILIDSSRLSFRCENL